MIDKEKTIGQVRLALNGKRVQSLMGELKMYGHREAFKVFMEGVFFPLIEQVCDRNNGKDVPIKINERRLKW